MPVPGSYEKSLNGMGSVCWVFLHVVILIYLVTFYSERSIGSAMADFRIDSTGASGTDHASSSWASRSGQHWQMVGQDG